MWQKCQIDHLMWQKCQLRHLSSNLRPFFVSTAAVHAMEMSDSTLMRVSLTRAQAALDELRAKKLLPPPAGVGRGPSLMQITAALAVRNGECSVLGGKNIPQASQPSAAAKLFKVPIARIKDCLLKGTGARRDRTNQRDEQKHRGWWTSETATRYIYREHRGKTAETQDPLLPKPVYTPPWTRLAMREGRNTHTDNSCVHCRLEAKWHAAPSRTFTSMEKAHF